MRIHNLSVWVVTTICCKRRNQWSRHFDEVIPAAGVVNGTSQGLSRRGDLEELLYAVQSVEEIRKPGP